MNLKQLLVIFFLAAVIVPASAAWADDAQAPKILSLKGAVFMDEKPAVVGQAVHDGSVVRTDADAVCEILLNDKSIIRIQGNSHATLNLGSDIKTIALKSGTIVSFIKKLAATVAGKTGRYEIRTPAAVAGIRGTAFFVKVESPNSTYICDCNGVVYVMDENKGHQKVLSAKHHAAVRFLKTGKGIVVSKAEMKYHTDAEMQGLAHQVGMKIDWTVVDKKP